MTCKFNDSCVIVLNMTETVIIQIITKMFLCKIDMKPHIHYMIYQLVLQKKQKNLKFIDIFCSQYINPLK